jgi:pilus assembly protein CpaF
MNLGLSELSQEVREFALDKRVGVDAAINTVLDSRAEETGLSAGEELRLRKGLSQKLVGFGFLQRFLDDESIEEVWINRPGEVWFAKSGQHFSESVAFSGSDLSSLVERMIRSSGRRLDRSTPFIDAQLESGYRLHAVVPDITQKHLSLNIRKFSRRVLEVQDLVASGMLTAVQALFLVGQLRQGANLMISGATQAGKTTLLTALISSLDTSERVVSVEDTFELRCLLPDWVAMQTRPASIEGRFEIDLRRLVRETLRMRPTRLVVGEVRGAESLDMLIAMNSGIPGLCTIHANSSEEALKKLQTLPLLAGGNISSVFLDNIIRASMQLFVHCRRDSDGQRKVVSIMRLAKGDTLTLEEVSV